MLKINKLSLKLELRRSSEDLWIWRILDIKGQPSPPCFYEYAVPNQQAIEINIAAFLNKERWDLDEIQQYGSNICQELLPTELIKIFQQYTSGDILFSIPPQVADIPFEFLYIPNMGFLNLYFQIGISICIPCERGFGRDIRSITSTKNRNKIKKTDKFLIISNTDIDKKAIRDESRLVKNGIKKNNYATYLIATRDKKRITEALQKNSIVHFSGRSSVDGWELSNGTTFDINTIENLRYPDRVPWLIFSNSCKAGRFGNTEQISGIAGAFIKVGVKTFIAPINKVNSQESQEFALLFYKYLFKEKYPSSALFYARKDMVERYPNSITPFLYRFFGDPAINSIIPIIKIIISFCILLLVAAVVIVFNGSKVKKFEVIIQPEMTFYTNFSTVEYDLYENIVNRFCEKNNVKIKVINLHADTLTKYIQHNDSCDLVHIDINKINDINLNEKLLDISKFIELIPSDMDDTMLKHIRDVERYQGITTKHLIPFRNNVKLIFVNRVELQKIINISPDESELLNWDTLLYWAKQAKKNKGRPMFILPGIGDDAANFLVEFIRSVGGEPMNLHDSLTKLALDSLRSIWPYFKPGDYNRMTGALKGGKAIGCLNWSFTYFSIKDSIDNYLIYSGLKWSQDKDPSNILGGECIGIPKIISQQNLKHVLKFIRFLMSDPIQKEFYEQFGWPPIKLNGLKTIDPEYLKYYNFGIKEALWYTKPVPVEWNVNIKNCFVELFDQITNSSNDIDSLVNSTQNKIDSLSNP